MHRHNFAPLALVLTVALLLAGTLAAYAQSVPRISSDELKGRLGESNLVILDARQPGEWSAATEKIVGAQRAEPAEVEAWAGRYGKDQVLIVYCS